jgi:hypothetical protein
METKILTNNFWTDDNGNHVLLHIEINDGSEVWTKAELIAPSDVQRVMDDALAINDIATELANKAILMRPAEKSEEEYQRILKMEQVKQENLSLELELEKVKLESLKLQK